MSPAIHQSPPRDCAYQVQGPRATDAIGEALRGAYRDADSLPADIAAILASLDHGRA